MSINGFFNPLYHDRSFDRISRKRTFFPVGYSLDDVVFAWTGHGVNTDRDMKLSQFDLIRTPTGNGTKNQNKSEFQTSKTCAHKLPTSMLPICGTRATSKGRYFLCNSEPMRAVGNPRFCSFFCLLSWTFSLVLSIHPPTNLP